MSVAFRRESDEEHKEPKFELPLPPGPNLVTARGLAQIEARVAEREALVQQQLDEDALAVAQRELRYWRTRLATAQLAPLPPADEAAFGSRVTFTLNGQRKRVEIVGDDEADPHAGLISFSAPLARALIGAGPGDMADFGGRADAIEILEVGPRDA
ncbi:GreA/GreB family elongation factor [Sphingosinicella sp. BN140058]|uniref:GreA/GreB family elongation factor n=1 Tax=Sphingosinicella sp. BN140058 TaxID=1892855 RepID=UPI001011E58F|nr:GreA/GreB family elongation factor [Sphingosinicella sp. BN140058]QAY76799.1 nucleoside-diphosphate kinase [Sphingosinicella sp. BN140058]